MKKALLFDPYLDTLGGGERYFLTLAEALSDLGYSVDIAWHHDGEIEAAKTRFGLKLNSLKLVPEAYKLFSGGGSLFKRYLLTSKYDAIFYVSDGSLPFLFSKNNLVHFQVPFKQIGGHKLLNKIKLQLVHKLVYNSIFTKNIIEKSLGPTKSVVLYPPIDTDNFKVGKKSDVILGVGRFASPSHSKRQDILITAFGEFSKKHSSYKLILAGGGKEDSSEVLGLRKQAKNLPVEILVNPEFSELKKLYRDAKFFWHAAGFGIDEEKNPEKVEHFGMTTVEAMSAGCIPVVIAKGGQKEILQKYPGLLTNSEKEIILSTDNLSISDTHKLQAELIKESKKYSIEKFTTEIKKIL